MRTIVAGSRGFFNYAQLEKFLNELQPPASVIISGGAKGADRLAIQYANRHKVALEVYYPDWRGQGKAAGLKRNMLMAEKAERLVAFWDGRSRGTEHMISTARAYGLPTLVVECKELDPRRLREYFPIG